MPNDEKLIWAASFAKPTCLQKKDPPSQVLPIQFDPGEAVARKSLRDGGTPDGR